MSFSQIIPPSPSPTESKRLCYTSVSLLLSRIQGHHYHLSAAAKSLQSCPTLCDPIDGSPPDFPIPGILQARTLEWVAIFSKFHIYALVYCIGVFSSGLLHCV